MLISYTCHNHWFANSMTNDDEGFQFHVSQSMANGTHLLDEERKEERRKKKKIDTEEEKQKY